MWENDNEETEAALDALEKAMLPATLAQKKANRAIVALMSFRKLFANDRALFAKDRGDKHPDLNNYKGPATLIVSHS